MEAKSEASSEVSLTRALHSAGLGTRVSSSSSSGNASGNASGHGHGGNGGGYETPDRFGQPCPHPPAVSPRHIGLGMHLTKMNVPQLDIGAPTLAPGAKPSSYEAPERGLSPAVANRLKGEENRERDREEYDMRTPRAPNAQPVPHFHSTLPHPHSHPHPHQSHDGRPTRQRSRTVNGRNWRSRSHDTTTSRTSGAHGPGGRQRAFAAWGYDESDPSDSDNT